MTAQTMESSATLTKPQHTIVKGMKAQENKPSPVDVDLAGIVSLKNPTARKFEFSGGRVILISSVPMSAHTPR